MIVEKNVLLAFDKNAKKAIILRDKKKKRERKRAKIKCDSYCKYPIAFEKKIACANEKKKQR